ncbi:MULTISPECIES: SCO6745 family protein [unclassified Isoptericola]|uniref:SCO6745 family protein n=1 Tax=unclassified Isoptericola TaxID=2623355 RepID=UPI00364C249B
MSQARGLARQMWHALEPVHALFWYAPEVFAEAAGLGFAVDSRWPSYFAWRAAPLGAAGAQQVGAAFYSFSPRTTAEHVPAAWRVAEPERILEARLRGVDAMYRAVLGDRVVDGGGDLAEAAALAREAAGSVATAGRPLAAANADLPWPDEPHLALWHAIGILREHRGDGHVAALLTAGLDPVEALVSFAAIGAAPVEAFAGRGWTDDEWLAARDRLAARGLVDGAGEATAAGRELRDAVERTTDDLAAAPWLALGPQKAGRLAQLTGPLREANLRTGLYPRATTLGIGTVQAT